MLRPFPKEINKPRVFFTALVLIVIYGIAGLMFYYQSQLSLLVWHKDQLDSLVTVNTLNDQKVARYNKAQNGAIIEGISRYLNVEATGN